MIRLLVVFQVQRSSDDAIPCHLILSCQISLVACRLRRSPRALMASRAPDADDIVTLTLAAAAAGASYFFSLRR